MPLHFMRLQLLSPKAPDRQGCGGRSMAAGIERQPWSPPTAARDLAGCSLRALCHLSALLPTNTRRRTAEAAPSVKTVPSLGFASSRAAPPVDGIDALGQKVERDVAPPKGDSSTSRSVMPVLHRALDVRARELWLSPIARPHRRVSTTAAHRSG